MKITLKRYFTNYVTLKEVNRSSGAASFSPPRCRSASAPADSSNRQESLISVKYNMNEETATAFGVSGNVAVITCDDITSVTNNASVLRPGTSFVLACRFRLLASTIDSITGRSLRRVGA